jgi:hypothetical protein
MHLCTLIIYSFYMGFSEALDIELNGKTSPMTEINIVYYLHI